jgi:hypothetical protein
MRSHCCPCVCVCVCVCVSLGIPPIVARQRLGKSSLVVVGNSYVFYAVRVVSKESRRLVLPRTSCFKLYSSSCNTVFCIFGCHPDHKLNTDWEVSEKTIRKRKSGFPLGSITPHLCFTELVQAQIICMRRVTFCSLNECDHFD